MLTAMEGSDNGTALTTDFRVIAQRMKLLGFNAIRLPLSFQVTDPVSATLVLLEELQPAHLELLSCPPVPEIHCSWPEFAKTVGTSTLACEV